ncbi:transposase [Paraburkholderia youngii]|uniref:transposase n=1 Tax=Paraburkholderia youngii TaxID=2782701 RepID=UPI0035E3F915
MTVLLTSEAAPQRRHVLRDIFNALLWMVRAGASWRMLSTSFPPYEMCECDDCYPSRAAIGGRASCSLREPNTSRALLG